MVRNYVRKTARNTLTVHETKALVQRVTTHAISFRKAAVAGLSKSTLQRFCNKMKQGDPTSCTFKKTFHHLQTFTPDQEKELSLYLIVAQKLNHGLTPRKTRKLAYIYGKANDIDMPRPWRKNESAGQDWFAGFMKRNTNLSIRKPERCSKAREAAVNHYVIDKFYDKLSELLTKYNFEPSEIYNCDETNNKTVVDPPKVVAETGTRQVCV